MNENKKNIENREKNNIDISSQGYSKAVDMWSLGVILYVMYVKKYIYIYKIEIK